MMKLFLFNANYIPYISKNDDYCICLICIVLKAVACSASAKSIEIKSRNTKFVILTVNRNFDINLSKDIKDVVLDSIKLLLQGYNVTASRSLTILNMKLNRIAVFIK